MEQKWPATLWLIRHGQSLGNVARDAAELASHPVIDIVTRDVDTPLSTLGEQQSAALGAWFATLPAKSRPTAMLCSPYVRAQQTAALIAQRATVDDTTVDAMADERLREKEFGILDRLTRHGIAARYPDLASQRSHVGKFYFRPPGGESWCDVVLRLRSILDTLVREYRSERVMIVTHQVVVNCMRYLLERMSEADILAIDREGDVPNCAVTSYEFDRTQGRHGKLMPRLVNFVVPLEQAGTPVTAEPDKPAAPKS